MSRTEQMTEFDERLVAEAEADLDRLLSIEPSPEFIAKVRARIAAEPPVRRWNWGRLLIPVAAAACLVLAVIYWNGHDDEKPFATARHGDVALRDETPKEPLAPVSPGLIALNRPAVPRAAVVPQREPEIIIDPSIAEAIRRLAVGARNTTLDASRGESIAAPDSASDSLPIAEQLNVPELVLKPADQTGGQ
jgi:hypothetical protein